MTRRIMVINFNANWMPKFWTRAVDICREARKQKVDMIIASELATYNNAEHLSDLMRWGGKIVKSDHPKAGDSCVLHGMSVPVATGIIWNPDQFTCDHTGMITKARTNGRAGILNNWSTVGKFGFEGERLWIASDHAEYRPQGPNNIKKYNEWRDAQGEGVIDHLLKPGRDLLWAGDMNDSLHDKLGATSVMKRHGLKDSDQSAVRKYNQDRTLAKAGWTKGGRIIRAIHTPHLKVTLQNTINMHDWTDHNALLIDIGW